MGLLLLGKISILLMLFRILERILNNRFWYLLQAICMAKWEMVSRPKDQGGLSIINTKVMNECLLTKWIWKILQEPEELWFKILIKAKYMRGRNFFLPFPRAAHNSGRVFTKSSISLSGGPFVKLEMGEIVCSGMIAGFKMLLLRLLMMTYI